ncbi:MAG: TlpA family protein disulfide reductase [Alphaproteobacteria bacterium]|nr:TlpA family protein disulfide reductase [Alphaproteobacteria bacterium]
MEQFTLNTPPPPVPDTPFADADGRAAKLADFRGRLTLVNFWATWCAPCVRELPSLDRLQAAFDEKKFRVVAINEDRRGAAVAKPFLAKLGLTRLALYIDTRLALAQALGLRGMPTSYLIDPAGRVIGALTGPAEWDTPEAKALIGYYLNRKKSPGRAHAMP